MYNVFRLTGDGLHCLALLVLFFKMNQTGSCAGLSLKTAYLYAIVFSCRCECVQRAPYITAPETASIPRVAVNGATDFLDADLDLITMWFIDLPEDTSLWEYTSVRPAGQTSALPAAKDPRVVVVGVQHDFEGGILEHRLCNHLSDAQPAETHLR